jgi:hypothetical protein
LSDFDGVEATDFIHEFGLDESSPFETVLILAYYMFTTLSTVGLGDFHPKSSIERMVITVIMLVGVMLTSLIIQNMVTMAERISDLNSSLGQPEDLDVFFSILRSYNNDKKLLLSLRTKIKSHCEYRWAKDRN